MQDGTYARFRSGRVPGVWLLAAVLATAGWSCRQRQASWEELNDGAVKALAEGRSVEAERQLRAALELARGSEQDAHRLRLSLHRMARFYEARQRYTQAAEFYALAFEEDLQRLSADDPDLYDTVNRLAGMHELNQHVAEAREVYRRFLALQESQLGGAALPLAGTLVQVGRLARLRGAYEEAEESFQRALSIRIRHLGQDNDELPEILDEYVMLLRDTEQPYKADLMEERAARLRMNRTARRLQGAAGN